MRTEDTMTRCLSALILVGMVMGCGDPGPAETPTIEGQWRQSGDLRDVLTGDSHIHIGTFNLRLSPEGFGGVGQQESDWCATAATGEAYIGPLANPQPFAITEGRVEGDSVWFRSPTCEFAGQFTDDRHWRMTGTAACTVVQAGKTFEFTGQWQADR
jgi:hypothetical protein